MNKLIEVEMLRGYTCPGKGLLDARRVYELTNEQAAFLVNRGVAMYRGGAPAVEPKPAPYIPPEVPTMPAPLRFVSEASDESEDETEDGGSDDGEGRPKRGRKSRRNKTTREPRESEAGGDSAGEVPSDEHQL